MGFMEPAWPILSKTEVLGPMVLLSIVGNGAADLFIDCEQSFGALWREPFKLERGGLDILL